MLILPTDRQSEAHDTKVAQPGIDVENPSGTYTETIARIQSLYDEGMFTRAYTEATPLGPLQQWQGTEARVLAGRLASQLSSDRLGDALVLRAWRADRAAPAAVLYGSMVMHSMRGTLATLDMLDASGILLSDNPLRWDATAYAAYLHGCYRDFETAELMINQAVEKSGTPWIWSQRAALFEMDDRYEDALEAAKYALKLNPRSRTAIQYTSRFYSLFERDEEAMSTLSDALKLIESPRIAAQLANLEIEHGLFEKALATLDHFDQLALIKDKRTHSWLAGRRCDIYSHMGDNQRALEQARLSTAGFYKKIAERLERATPASKRVMLPVGFVRQHHMTCAPATISALSRYWSKPADHLELAEAICYDGTPHHSQRIWASEHGWHVREFTASWEASRALIDAGIPFTLSTVHPGSAHLQAVIGYDMARGVLFIRDPYDRTHTEFAEKAFFESYASSGPRGMAMVPDEARARLDALDLPDAALHDMAQEIQSALLVHDRERAETACDTLEHSAPGHRLAISGRRSLASYDGDRPAAQVAIEQLLEKYPDDVNLRLSKADLLQQLASHDTYLAYLEGEINGKSSHALLDLRYAQALLDDGRQYANAATRLRKLARNWNKSETLSSLADAHWHEGETKRAVQLYRLAATLEETSESHARTYLRATRMVRDEARGFAFLRNRVERLGKLSPDPWITLFDCLDEIDRTAEAIEVRAQALEKHPENGEMLLFAARSTASVGEYERSQDFLARARPRCKPTEWLRTAARLSDDAGELAESLRLWHEIATAEPLDLSAQRAVARLLSETQGRKTTLSYLRQLVERFPHHQKLNELLVDWLDEAPLPEQEEALQRLLAISPANAWGRRQLALVLAKQQRFEEARVHANIAAELAPTSVALHTTMGQIELLAGRLADSRTAFRKALLRQVDSDFALSKLIEASTTLGERRIELTFVLEEMKRQVITGDCLLSMQRLAHDTLEPEALASVLEEARSSRADLWQSWVACGRQQMEMQQYDAARILFQQAIEKFPFLPRLHVEMSDAERLSGNRIAERDALHEALRLNPGWSYASRKLADSLEADGDFAGSRSVLDKALRHSPTDSLLHGYLGHALWQLKEREAAIVHLEQAARLDPAYNWAWHTLKDRATALGKPDAALLLAREISLLRPGEVSSWNALARISNDIDEKISALDCAIKLAPLSLDAHELKLDLLIEHKRHDEVLAALRSTAWGDRLPIALRLKETKALAAKEDYAAAIKLLRTVLEDDPNCYPAWEQLTDCHEAKDEHAEQLVAAREMHRIAPNEAHALGYLAEALLKAEPDTDVRPYLRRALHLKPDYGYAGHTLFDRELKAGDLEAAGKVLSALTPHFCTAYTRLRNLRLSVKRGNLADALAVLNEFWQTSDDDLELFQHAIKAFDQAGWSSAAEDALELAVLESKTNPLVGTLWVERRARPKLAFMRFHGLVKLLKNSECGQVAAQGLLRHYIKKENAGGVRSLLKKHGQQLALNTTTHGLAAYALVRVATPGEVLKWFGDWRKRTEIAPWALLNLASSLHDLDRRSEALAVSSHALTLKEDHSFPEHKVWLASDAARHGKHEEAKQLLATLDEEDLNAYYQFLCCCIRALSCASDRSKSPEYALKLARIELQRAQELIPLYLNEPALRRMLWRSMWQIAQQHSSYPALAPMLWVRLVLE